MIDLITADLIISGLKQRKEHGFCADQMCLIIKDCRIYKRTVSALWLRADGLTVSWDGKSGQEHALKVCCLKVDNHKLQSLIDS